MATTSSHPGWHCMRCAASSSSRTRLASVALDTVQLQSATGHASPTSSLLRGGGEGSGEGGGGPSLGTSRTGRLHRRSEPRESFERRSGSRDRKRLPLVAGGGTEYVGGDGGASATRLLASGGRGPRGSGDRRSSSPPVAGCITPGSLAAPAVPSPTLSVPWRGCHRSWSCARNSGARVPSAWGAATDPLVDPAASDGGGRGGQPGGRPGGGGMGIWPGGSRWGRSSA